MSTAIKVNATNLDEVAKDLLLLIDQLGERDKSFANDLLNGKHGYFVKGALSEKQMYWVGVLAGRALGLKPEKQAVGNLSKLVELFAAAKGNLKHPKIKLEIDGEPLKLTLAGPQAKHPGTINITDGGPWGDNKWYGRVTAEGEWEPSSVVTEPLRKLITTVLENFSINAKHAAMSYGHASSQCCFCAKQLDTKESVSAGYGPVCADKWGLPWGDK